MKIFCWSSKTSAQRFGNFEILLGNFSEELPCWPPQESAYLNFGNSEIYLKRFLKNFLQFSLEIVKLR
jgi:hypothetical protein